MIDNSSFRTLAGTLVHPSVKKYIRRCFRRTVSGLGIYQSAIAGKHGLELGGPSGIFSDEGILPIYKSLSSLDNCLYATRTIWTGDVQSGGSFNFHAQKANGNQIICDASDLSPIPNEEYQCVLASHCLEHIANPLRALGEWKRVLTSDGLVVLILPHKDGTFDWRRPTTTLSHMISDYENNTEESDLTHLEEILTLHDLERDKAAGTKEQFRERCLRNSEKRAIHHHVFDTHAALALLDRASFQILRVDIVRPYHIIALARRCDGAPDNSKFLSAGAEYRAMSPFPSDRTVNSCPI